MTVAELTKKLMEMPPDRIVLIADGHSLAERIDGVVEWEVVRYPNLEWRYGNVSHFDQQFPGEPEWAVVLS